MNKLSFSTDAHVVWINASLDHARLREGVRHARRIRAILGVIRRSSWGDMAELVAYVSGVHDADLREVLTGYLEEGAARLERAFGVEQDIPAALVAVMGQLSQFAPPAGRLLLVVEGKTVLGCGGLRPLGPGVAEIKRMYLRPEARGRGLGRKLLDALLTTARQEGYQEVRLDTDGLMPAARQLYWSAGFQRCDPYPQSELPVELHDRWLFFRRDLTDVNQVP